MFDIYFLILPVDYLLLPQRNTATAILIEKCINKIKY